MIILGILIGGSIGGVIAIKINMTSLPQLVAAFHSLVGMAAVFVATAALYHPEAYGIGNVGSIHAGSLIEMGLGVAIGAITFSGSVIAFLKLQGLMSGNPITFPMQHPINALIGVLILGCIIWFCVTESYAAYWLLVLLAFAIGFLLIIPIGGADMPVVVSMLNSYSGWAACGIGFTLQNPALGDRRRAGGFVGRHPQLHHVQGDEPVDLQRAPRRLRRRGCRSGGRWPRRRPFGQVG